MAIRILSLMCVLSQNGSDRGDYRLVFLGLSSYSWKKWPSARSSPSLLYMTPNDGVIYSITQWTSQAVHFQILMFKNVFWTLTLSQTSQRISVFNLLLL